MQSTYNMFSLTVEDKKPSFLNNFVHNNNNTTILTLHNANSSIKDDNLSSSTQVLPLATVHPSSNSSTPMFLSPSPGADVNTSKCMHLSLPYDDDDLLPLDYTKATIPTFYNKKPPLISHAPTTAKLKDALRCQPQVSCVSFSRL
jgi:hypothetical protein